MKEDFREPNPLDGVRGCEGGWMGMSLVHGYIDVPKNVHAVSL